MATQSPHRKANGTAPAADGFPNGVPECASDNAPDLSPWPVADTPGRPFIHPHRLANVTRDRGMVEALGSSEIERRIRGDRLADQIRSWVIAISLTLMGLAILGTLCDAALDRLL